jgi:hypothetical protein
MKVISLFITLFLFISCGADQLNDRSPSSEGSKSNQESNSCVCTFEYSPVCSKGVTYDNPCIAKCNNVTSFTNGKCSCAENSGEVCATPPMPECPPGMACAQVMPAAKTYANECEMIKESATFIKRGACN